MKSYDLSLLLIFDLCRPDQMLKLKAVGMLIKVIFKFHLLISLAKSPISHIFAGFKLQISVECGCGSAY